MTCNRANFTLTVPIPYMQSIWLRNDPTQHPSALSISDLLLLATRIERVKNRISIWRNDTNKMTCRVNEIFLVNRQCLARIRTARCTASYWLLAPFECRMLPRTRAPVHWCVWSTNRGDRMSTQSWIEKHSPRDIHRTALATIYHETWISAFDIMNAVAIHTFLNHLITPDLSLNIDYVRLLS